MPRVLVAGRVHPSGIALLRDAQDIELDYLEDVTTAAMLTRLETAEAVLLRMQEVTEEVLRQAPNLRFVSRHGVGYDTVDVAALNRRGIALSIVGDVLTRTVAEHTMLLLLSSSHRLPVYDAAARPGGDWSYRNSLSAREISGKTLLIIGFGRIGRRVARMAAGFDIRVHVHDPFLAADAELPEGVTRADDLHEGLRLADMVTLHMPKTDRVVLGAEELGLLPSHAVVVNTARGGLIDEAALQESLSEGRLHAAGLDVFEAEPPGNDHPLVAMEQVVVTPHAASLTAECAERMSVAAATNIIDFFQGTLDPALVVNASDVRWPGGDPV